MIEQIITELAEQYKNSSLYFFNKNAFKKIKKCGSNLMMCCPFHVEDNASFGISIHYPFLYNCFSCGAKGSLVNLIKYVMNISYTEAEMYLISKLNIDVSFLWQSDIISFSYINYTPKLSDKASLYLKQRGFTNRTIQKYELGGDDSHVLIPVRTDLGDIRFIKKRSLLGKSYENSFNVSKKDILYGLYYLVKANNTKEIYVTEGEFDTLACYQMKLSSVALMGSVLFDEQIELLLKYGVKIINLFLDNDEVGFNASLKIYKKLMKYPFSVNFVLYPPPRWGLDTKNSPKIKDPNDVLKAGLQEKLDLVPIEKILLKI